MNPEEHNIWQTAKAQGKSDAFIKGAILAFRNRPVATQPVATTLPPAPDDSKKTGGILGAVGRFVGVDKLGIGLGRAVNNATGQPDELLALSKQHSEQIFKLNQMLRDPNITPERKTHIQAILSNNPDYAGNAYNDVSTAGLTNKEVIGSAAQTALNIGLAGSASGLLSGSGKLAAATAPAALKSGAGAVFARIGTKAATGFAAGGALGTAQGITDNKSIGESLKEGLISGTVGAVLGGSLQGVSEVVRGLTAPSLTKKIYDSALGVSKKTAQSGKSPSTQLIKEGVIGTAHGIYDRAQTTIDDVEPQINALLRSSPKSVKLESVLSSLAHGVNTAVGNEGKGAITSTEMKQIIQDSLPQVRTLLGKDELTLAEANQLRQIMDRTLGDRAFTGATLPFKKDVLFDASNSLRRLVQSLAPETKALFKQYSTSVQTIKALNSEMNKPHVLRHMLSLLAGVGGGLPGLLAGATNEVAQTTAAKTATAVGLNTLHKGLQATDKSIAADIVKRLARLGVLNTVKSVTSGGIR